ncbi:expressed unknown protein [Seminavis robusta]|uniref:Uncharacterized protein n=1 Tax=Seminavis robusta TaxID=568900 RepID=A0A9N8ERA9_9STRA|nr:expressed unknown protein [Seminavis robusta]|eukprot:Sro1665_g289580.1 n/a (182) ;mRNA; f:10261-10806
MSPAKKLTTEQKIINAAATLSRRGKTKHVCRKKVAAMCGFNKETKSYGNCLGNLKNKKKFIAYDKETIELLPAGEENAEPEAELGSNAEVLEACKAKVTGGKPKQVLDILSDGRTYSRAKIGEMIGSDHTKKSFINILSPLKKPGYIEYVKDENDEPALRMHDDMFPFGGRPGSSSSDEDA